MVFQVVTFAFADLLLGNVGMFFLSSRVLLLMCNFGLVIVCFFFFFVFIVMAY